MAHLLAYWKIYWKEPEWEKQSYSATQLALKDSITRTGWGFKHNRFCAQIRHGETLWVIGRGGPPGGKYEAEWRLLMRMLMDSFCTADQYQEVQPYVHRIRPGNFDLYHPHGQPNAEPLLKGLTFLSGQAIPAAITGGRLGKYFQNLRPLTEYDCQSLTAWVRENDLCCV